MRDRRVDGRRRSRGLQSEPELLAPVSAERDQLEPLAADAEALPRAELGPERYVAAARSLAAGTCWPRTARRPLQRRRGRAAGAASGRPRGAEAARPTDAADQRPPPAGRGAKAALDAERAGKKRARDHHADQTISDARVQAREDRGRRRPGTPPRRGTRTVRGADPHQPPPPSGCRSRAGHRGGAHERDTRVTRDRPSRPRGTGAEPERAAAALPSSARPRRSAEQPRAAHHGQDRAATTDRRRPPARRGGSGSPLRGRIWGRVVPASRNAAQPRERGSPGALGGRECGDTRPRIDRSR